MLDLSPNAGLRRRPARPGLPVEGFGIDVADKNKIGDESDPRIVGHDVTDGAEEGGRTAMENLLQKDPAINLVYTINEPAAAGAYAGAEGGGQGERRHDRLGRRRLPRRRGRQGGSARRHLAAVPAEDGAGWASSAIAAFAKDGTKPENTAGKDFVDTGVKLITDQPQTGVDVQGHRLRPAELLGLTVLGPAGGAQAGPSPRRSPHGTGEVPMPNDDSSGGGTATAAEPDTGFETQARVAGPAHPARPARQPDPGPARGAAPVDHRVLDHQRPVPLGGEPRRWCWPRSPSSRCSRSVRRWSS